LDKLVSVELISDGNQRTFKLSLESDITIHARICDNNARSLSLYNALLINVVSLVGNDGKSSRVGPVEPSLLRPFDFNIFCLVGIVGDFGAVTLVSVLDVDDGSLMGVGVPTTSPLTVFVVEVPLEVGGTAAAVDEAIILEAVGERFAGGLFAGLVTNNTFGFGPLAARFADDARDEVALRAPLRDAMKSRTQSSQRSELKGRSK
jgi:hypothetical protein